MLRVTLEGLKQPNLNYPGQPRDKLLLAITYLQRNLSEEEFSQSLPSFLDAAFLGTASPSTIVTELQQILKQWEVMILPAIRHLTLDTLKRSDAIMLAIKLTAHSTFSFVMSEEELPLPDNPILQAADQLVDRFLNKNNPPHPATVIQVLSSIFEKFPETQRISAFNDLTLQAELALESYSPEDSLIGYAIEKLTPRKWINSAYLDEAHTAFKQWKKSHKTYIGFLRRVIEQADRLSANYPTVKKYIPEFCAALFEKLLVDKQLLPGYLKKFSRLVEILIALTDKSAIFSLCFHLANRNKNFTPSALIALFDHPIFQAFTIDQQRIILKMITTSLNHDLPLSLSDLRFLLDQCRTSNTRMLLLQCFHGLYLQAPVPKLETVVDWIKQVDSKNLSALNKILADGYLSVKQPEKIKPDSICALLEKQLNKLRRDLEGYQQTSFLHKRKYRAAQLSEFSMTQLNAIDATASAQRQALLRQTVAELYFHYATIEDASGILSRTLEKRLIKLMQIPNNEELKAAREMREGFLYKLHTFFHAGRSCFKSYHDKARDPVHQIIMRHLDPAIKGQIRHLKTKIRRLDRLDQRETAWFELPPRT